MPPNPGRSTKFLLYFNTLYFKPVYNTPVNQVFIDDFIDIFPIEVGVPDIIRVDHDNRAKFAPVETARAIDPDLSLARQAQLLDPVLGVVAYLHSIALLTALLALLAPVGAEKNMVLVIRHWSLL